MTPTEAGYFWARLREPRNPKWEIVYLLSARSGNRVAIAADDGMLDRDEDIAEWGPRIPEHEKLQRMTEIYERYCRGIDAAARAGGMPPSLDYRPVGWF